MYRKAYERKLDISVVSARWQVPVHICTLKLMALMVPFSSARVLSPVIYRVSKGEQPKEAFVHLARIKTYFAPSAGSNLEIDTLDDLFLGTKIAFLDFENVTSQVRIGNLMINAIGKHKCGPGKPSLTNFQYFFTFRGYPPSQGALPRQHCKTHVHLTHPRTNGGPRLLNRLERPFPRLPERNISFLFRLFSYEHPFVRPS